MAKQTKISNAQETLAKIAANQSSSGAELFKKPFPHTNSERQGAAGDEDGEDSRNLAFTDELAPEIVSQDFIARDCLSGRRAFLLDYCREVNERDFKTERALQSSAYLSDEKLLAIPAKIKPQTTPNSLQLMNMNSSGAAI